MKEYGIALTAAAVVLLADGLAELGSMRWHWRYSRPVLRIILAGTAWIVALILWFCIG